MTAFRFVTLVCDTCYAAFDPGTALTVENARAEAADRGWAEPEPEVDLCGACSAPQASGSLPDLDLELGDPIPL